MAELRAPEQNRLLGQLANMLRTTEGDIAAPEFLPRGLDVMGLVRQLMLPSAETVEKMSYGDPLFRMPTQSNIPITADREYLADVVGMAPMVPAASRATTRLSNEAADALVRAITRNPEATAPGVLEAAGQMLPMSRIVRENPEPFMVAHGTTEPFAEFKSGMGRTARDIYTVPESLSEDASLYGSVLIKATASPKKMIDFSDYDKLDQQTISAIKKAAEDSGVTDEYYTFDSFLDDLMTGQLYQSGGGPRAQNNFLAELFSEYDAVKMPDARVGGGLSQSVVVQNPNLLKVKEVDGEPVEKVFPGLLDQPAQSVVETSYRGSHSAPNAETYGATLDSLEGIMPADVYSSRGKRLYGLGNPNVDAEWFAAAFKAKGKPDAKVTIYRAVPKGVKEINSGDWVTTSKTYADMHGERTVGDEYEILSKKVRAKTLASEGYPYEFGYNE
jgi:hypothetical protein